MLNRLQAIFPVAALAIIAAAPLHAEDLTVEGAVAAALKNNPSLYNVEKARDATAEKVREYWGGVYPAIGAAATYTREAEQMPKTLTPYVYPDNIYNLNIGLTQVVWAGGKVRTGIRMAELFSDSAEQSVRQARMGLAKSVRTLCYDIILSSATALIQDENLRLAQQHLEQITARFRQGLSSDLEELRQEVEVSNAKPAVTQARNLLETGLLSLKQILGVDPDRNLSLIKAEDPGSDGDETLDALYKEAIARRPELINARLQYRLAGEQITLARSEFYPYVNAFVNRTYSGYTNNTFPSGGESAWSTTAGLQLQLSLFSGGATNSRIRQAKIAQDQARETLEDTERVIRIDVKRAWLNLKEARERLSAQEGAVGQARKALVSVEIRFKNGLSSPVELNDATLALNQAQLLRVQAMRDVYASLADLEWSRGK